MNLTLLIADDVVERAREVARQQGTSLNALIRQYLERLADGVSGDDLAGEFDALWQERSGNSGGWRFDRDELYGKNMRGTQSS